MKPFYKLNKITMEEIFNNENCSVYKIEKKSGVDHKTLNKMIDEQDAKITEEVANKLSKAYNIKKYDLIIY